jgi:FlaA1/EpsC-like NDP-sugar epimerase
MRKRLKNLLDKRFLPRWIVLLADLFIISVTFMFTYLLRFNLFSQHADVPVMMLQLIAGFPFFILVAYIFKPHQGILRHSTVHDALLLAVAYLFLSGGFFVISYLGRIYYSPLVIPTSVIIVHYFMSVFLMVLMRFSVQFVYRNLLIKPKDTVNVMIYGAGKLGNIAHSLIIKDDNIHYKIVGYLDDNPGLWNSRIGGIKVFPPEKAFEHFVKCLNVKEMILAISPARIDLERKRKIVDECINLHLKVREVPDPSTWLDGKFAGEQIRNVRIEDLLGRDPISLDIELVTQGIAGKRVMVTGGAGSIGSEIVRQLVYLKPQSIIIVDQAESALFDIRNEILPLLDRTVLQTFVADVTDNLKCERFLINAIRKSFIMRQPINMYRLWSCNLMKRFTIT